MKEKNSPDERFEASTATYEREEMEGPLKRAATKVRTVIEETISTKKDVRNLAVISSFRANHCLE
jgi:hypothetical protein